MHNLGSGFWDLIEKAAHVIWTFIFRFFKKNPSDETFSAFMQFVKFGIVGVSNTIISYVLYVVGLLVFQKIGILPRADYLVAQMIAFVLSVLWSFYWNNKKVFTLVDGRQRSTWKVVLKTYVSYSFTGLFLNSVLLILWVQIIGISEFIAPIINLLVSVPLNFVINKFWTFK